METWGVNKDFSTRLYLINFVQTANEIDAEYRRALKSHPCSENKEMISSMIAPKIGSGDIIESPYQRRNGEVGTSMPSSPSKWEEDESE